MKIEPNLFSSEKNKIEPNPYLEARVHWNERFGYALSAAKNWRMIAFILATIVLILVVGFIYQASRSTLVPYVLWVDQAGNTVKTLKPGKADIEIGLIKTVLGQWISDMRGITPDTPEQKKRLVRVYSKIASNSVAKEKMDEMFNSVNYFEAGKKQLVTVEVGPILPIEDGRLSVEWEETKRERDGTLLSTSHKKATITYEMGALSNDERTLQNNPIGIYVTNFSISEIYK